jgi:translation initiation factor 1
MSRNKNPDNPFVYSTNPDFFGDEDTTEENEALLPEKQDLRLHLDRLKGNKKAVRITGFRGSETELENLAKQLKQACACGGGAKEDYILLQGDLMDRVKTTLTKLGYRFKQAGG